ncbi:MAG: hypothetical protein K9K67_11500 [Bacteriovoracaceae bacterium]|nr:hypothetical protein [Bacteriovoracaceae bacterium]
MYKFNIATILIFTSLTLFSCSKSDKTIMEKVETKSEEISDSVNEAYKDAKDEICEMIDGKLQCTKKRIESDVKDLVDE